MAASAKEEWDRNALCGATPALETASMASSDSLTRRLLAACLAQALSVSALVAATASGGATLAGSGNGWTECGERAASGRRGYKTRRRMGRRWAGWAAGAGGAWAVLRRHGSQRRGRRAMAMWTRPAMVMAASSQRIGKALAVWAAAWF